VDPPQTQPQNSQITESEKHIQSYTQAKPFAFTQNNDVKKMFCLWYESLTTSNCVLEVIFFLRKVNPLKMTALSDSGGYLASMEVGLELYYSNGTLV
jgi:hypothetical protein